MKKILIIRFSSIGDIVLTTPVVRCIKEQLPGVEVHYATKSAYRCLLEDNTYIDKIHLLDKDFNSLLNKLKHEQFDWIIDLHNNLRSRRLTFYLNSKVGRVKKLNFKKWLIVNTKIDLLPDVHIVDRYLDAAAGLGIKNDFKGLDFFLATAIDFDKIKLPDTHKANFIAWVIGGKHYTKILPVGKIINVCKQLKVPVVILGDNTDKARGDMISGAVSSVYNAAGQFSLLESAAIIKEASVVITNDTGLMHIAAAFQKKIISFWGNTVKDFGMYPYLPQAQNSFKILEVKDLRCRPCSKIGFKECPENHFKCMNDISEDEILGAVRGFIE